MIAGGIFGENWVVGDGEALATQYRGHKTPWAVLASASTIGAHNSGCGAALAQFQKCGADFGMKNTISIVRITSS